MISLKLHWLSTVKYRKIRAQILADGRVYAGQDALAEQLVDELGGLYEAVKYAGTLVNLEDPKIIYPNRGIKDWVQSFRAMAQSMSFIQPSGWSGINIQ